MQDGNGHGTHCIGTACGPLEPASGVRRYGIAGESKIYVGKVLGDDGSGSTSSILAGIEWALAAGCPVISLSLGSDVDFILQAYEFAARRALAAGSLLVAAAGNNARRSEGYFGFVGPPANSPSVLAVAAIDPVLRIAEFSARSSFRTGEAGKIDLAAPGVDIFSALPGNRGLHGAFSGTSMACPHVAGLAALVHEVTECSGAALWGELLRIARRIPGDVRDIGGGLVQAPRTSLPRVKS